MRHPWNSLRAFEKVGCEEFKCIGEGGPPADRHDGAQPDRREAGGSIRLLKPTKFTVQTLKMVGLLNLFPSYDDLGQAVESF